MKSIAQLAQSRWMRTAISLITLVLIVQAGHQLLPNCNLSSRLDARLLLWASLLAVIYRIVNAYGWAFVLRSVEQDIDGTMATAIWLRSEARRWLPGGVWGYASRAAQAGELNVSLRAASASMLLELILTLIASLLIVVPVTLCYYAESSAVIEELGIGSINLMPILSIVSGALLCLVVARRLVQSKIASLRSKVKILKSLSMDWLKLFQGLVFYTSMAFLNGLVTLVLLWSLSPENVPPAIVVISATSLSWLIGFFAVFAPGGVVVREGSFAIALVFWLPLPDGLMVAVAARLVQMLAEIVCLLAVTVNWRKAAERIRAGM